jgi:hypothetical protein
MNVIQYVNGDIEDNACAHAMQASETINDGDMEHFMPIYTHLESLCTSKIEYGHIL